MPWKEESVVSQRQRLVEQMLLPGANVKALTKLYGVSRKTAYKWLQRYKSGGLSALEDSDKTPLSQPRKISPRTESLIIATHESYPHWGPYKLGQYLSRLKNLSGVPSHTTIARVLKRNGCQVIRNNASAPASIRFERAQPNSLWQMDFKGSFMTKSRRCYPLTILDDHSRYSLGIRACYDETKNTVKDQLIEVFRAYGLPDQINVDNGNPWGAADLESYTSFTVWLLKQGIRLTHSAPRHPQTNGKLERFHRTLKLEVLHQKQYKNHCEVQRAFDIWQHVYNFERPHQGIDNDAPANRYQKSTRAYIEHPTNFEYGSDVQVRAVNEGGRLAFRGKRYKVGKAFYGERVALKETDDPNQFAVYFMDTFIKKLRLKPS